MRRGLLSLACLMLLTLAAIRIPPAPAWQGATPLSRTGQEDLTFWVNHNGLEQLDVEGEVGFGDMARILLRRRSNPEIIRSLRDRCTFNVQNMGALQTPDLFRAEITAGGLTWRNRPEHFVIAASKTFNLPVVVENHTGAPVQVAAHYAGSTADSSFPASTVPANSATGYFLRAVESQPGNTHGQLVLNAGGRELAADITYDVRALTPLHVALEDYDGKPTAARIYLTGSDGLAYAPQGSISRITAMSSEYYFQAEGGFDIDLPAGTTLIEATRGLEYDLTRREVLLEPGKPAAARVRLARWENLAAKGWYSSDSHIHANYTSPHHQAVTPEDMRLAAHAEDLNNANLMVANSSGAFLHDIQYFEGKPHRLSQPNFILYWSEEMRSSGLYGHMTFFDLKSLVYPLYTGYRDTPFADDYPANYAQAEAAKKQGAVVTYVHPGYSTDFATTGGAAARELPVDLALGQVDAIDVVSNADEISAMSMWYRLLNCGFRLAISAGTDSFTNVTDHYTPGGGRVYVHSGAPLRYGDWVASYKRGRSFATNGPMIFLTVDGKEPGDELHFPAGSARKVRVKATVRTRVPLDTLEIIVNGKPVISRRAAQNETTIDEELPVGESCWIAARALGPWSRMVLNDLQAFAHTSPVYVAVGAKPAARAEDARYWIGWIDQLIAQVKTRGRFSTAERRSEVVGLFQRAQEVYRKVEHTAEEVAP
jgi:TolB protein